MFVEGVGVGTANAEAVEGRNSHRAGEIAVGAAAGAAVGEIEAQILGNAARLFIERHGSGIGLPYRACHAALYLEGDVVGTAGKREHPFDAAIAISLALGHTERFAGAGRGDAIDPLSAMHDADAEGAVIAGHAVDLD